MFLYRKCNGEQGTPCAENEAMEITDAGITCTAPGGGGNGSGEKAENKITMSLNCRFGIYRIDCTSEQPVVSNVTCSYSVNYDKINGFSEIVDVGTANNDCTITPNNTTCSRLRTASPGTNNTYNYPTASKYVNGLSGQVAGNDDTYDYVLSSLTGTIEGEDIPANKITIK